MAPLIQDRLALLAAVLGAAIALVLTPAGLPVIAATAACLVGLTRPPRTRARRATVRPQEARS